MTVSSYHGAFIVLFSLVSLSLSLPVHLCQNDATDMCWNTKLMGPHPWNLTNGLKTESITFSAGVAFRVWAPHATSATVSPHGNVGGRWSSTSMSSESGGTFYVNVGAAAPGDAYVYVFQTPSGSITRLDPRAQDIDPSSTTNWQYSIVHDPNFSWNSGNLHLPPPTEIIVYELHIPTFSDSGDFDGAIAKLPFLQKLGINAIELMPTATFYGDSNGWGYDPAAPYATMPAFGGYKGLKRFVNAANSMKMGVILDLVWNHAYDQNILTKYDNNDNTNGIFFYSDSRATTPWGPRFNYDDPNVAQYILDSVTMWLQEYHISGFRWDSTVCMRKGGDGQDCWNSNANIPAGWELLQKANTLCQQYSTYNTAEDDQGFGDITKPVSDRNAGIPGAPGGAGFNSQWGYPFYYGFVPELILADNGQLNMGTVSNVFTNTNNDGGDVNRLMFTECHDMASNQNKGRIPSIIDPGGSGHKPNYWAQKKSMLGIAVLLTAPVFPMLFYGQEMLSYQIFNFPSPPKLDWGLATANAGLVQEVTDLIALRTNKFGTTKGLTGFGVKALMVVNDATNKVLVVQRSTTSSQIISDGTFSEDSDNNGISTSADGTVVVVVNMFQTNYTSFILRNMPSDGTWNIRFNGDLQKYSSLYGNFGASQNSVSVQGGQGSLVLPSYSVVILSQ